VPALHITNGDCAATLLRQFLDGPVVAQADVLHEGPAPIVDDETWLDLRARFLARNDGEIGRIREGLAASDRALDEASRYERVALWFEHDLFDQLQVIRTLSRLGRQPALWNRTSLICVDRFAGVEPFYGLGQLDVSQLSSLADQARQVTRMQFDTAERVWNAFRTNDPSQLNAIWKGKSSPSDPIDAFPFLRRAVGRFLAEYPSSANGVSATVLHALRELSVSPLDGATLFRRVQSREEAPFMGDTVFFDAISKISTARRPLVRIAPDDGGTDLRNHEIALTAAGRDVLAGRLDAVAQNGIDEWRGGVHLRGADRSAWRWDATRETLVSWSELPSS
jgi:hypothetical protein